MKIALLTLGTRGDVQPYAVLGQALKERGHDVTLSTAKNFEPLARHYQIKFSPVDADFQEFLETDEGKKMMKNPFRARRNLNKWVFPMIYGAMTTFYQLAQESDKVLYHIKTLGDYFADQFPEKMIRANVIPALQPTSEFVNPVFSGLHPPKFLNKFSYRISELWLKMMDKPIRQFREDQRLSLHIGKPEIPALYAISEHYLKKPSDYPADTHFTGFWTRPSLEPLDPEITNFLSQGAAPLLVTFGSMPFTTRFDIASGLIKLVETLGIRVIVVKGWGRYDSEKLLSNPRIKIIESAPYDKLFPLVKAVINHGGIGTITSCLQAGKPFFSCPPIYPLGDQHFWGTIGFRKGLALAPLALKNLTEESLIKNVSTLMTKEKLFENALAMSQVLEHENGVQRAIDEIENI
jgi:sterol 3beta-glucosyltransferase